MTSFLRLPELHACVRFSDLVEGVCLVNRHGGAARCDIVEEALKNVSGKVRRFAGIGGQANPLRDVVDGVEVFHGPFIGEHAGEADGRDLT